MTEQQFEKIKALLDASHPIDSSSKLDRSILNAAKQQAELNKQNYQHNDPLEDTTIDKTGFILSWLGRLNRGSFVQAAVLSLVLTFGLFFTMAQLLRLEQSDEIVAASQNTDLEFKKLDQTVTPPPIKTKVIPEFIEFKMPETQRARDQILANIPLPDIQELVDDITLPVADDNRQLAQNMISTAMGDMRLMLSNGNFNDARQRYALLKKRCDDCALPDSLEALIVKSTRAINST